MRHAQAADNAQLWLAQIGFDGCGTAPDTSDLPVDIPTATGRASDVREFSGLCSGPGFQADWLAESFLDGGAAVHQRGPLVSAARRRRRREPLQPRELGPGPPRPLTEAGIRQGRTGVAVPEYGAVLTGRPPLR